MLTVPDMMREAADVFEQRAELYGDNYKRFGLIMRALFPRGLRLASADDHNRFGVLVQCVSKLTRYAENFERGGHDDSCVDSAVYWTMLRELDEEIRARPEAPF